jgi:hypothetical protein
LDLQWNKASVKRKIEKFRFLEQQWRQGVKRK